MREHRRNPPGHHRAVLTGPRERLPAAERRQALVEAATRVFAKSSYQGATTAEIAAEAGVSEPILYRHFGSKRELYLACLEQAWQRLRACAEGETGGLRIRAISEEYMGGGGPVRLIDLWIQALSVAAEDTEIAHALQVQIREVHDWFASLIREGQEEGHIVADRDPVAEAWILLAGGMLATIDSRLGGFLGDGLERVRQERTRWMTGRN
jgi:TetR/AcrR family transcriptional regulator